MTSQITPVVIHKRKAIQTYDIFLSVPNIEMVSLPAVAGEYITQPLVELNGKRFYMRIYRVGFDSTSNGCMSFTFHVETTDYSVPLIVSFQIDIAECFRPAVYGRSK